MFRKPSLLSILLFAILMLSLTKILQVEINYMTSRGVSSLFPRLVILKPEGLRDRGKTPRPLNYIGSSTIGENIIPEMAEAFTAKTGIQFGSIKSPGSGAGLEALIEGKANFVGVSRPLTMDEKRQRFYYQIIGYDAISIFVHRNNPINNLTKEQVKRIFTGEIKNWKEVGGNDAPIVCITEIWGNKRATMIEFQRLAMDGSEYRADRIEVDKPKDQASFLASEKNGIISVSFVFASSEIKSIAVDNIIPEARHVHSGVYLFSRPLLLITRELPRGKLKKFFDFVFSPEGQKIVGKNFVPVKEYR